MNNPVEAAIAAAGSVVALARLAAVSHVSVVAWRRRGVIPASRIGVVAAGTGLGLRELRPELVAAAAPDFAPALAACRSSAALAVELILLLAERLDPLARHAIGRRLLDCPLPPKPPRERRRRQPDLSKSTAQEAPAQ